ncbi:MAG: right-handed parallel beta-helix repeat-containing protein, partial [Nocardioidaceae bacterium]|nr:right-handed parallel beta-helix repeat-containing protein [Nocardioidaceae bacterium]
MEKRNNLRMALLAAVLGGLIAVGAASPASAHEERPAGFPDGTGRRPTYAGLDNPDHRVVCTSDSERRIQAMPAGALRTRNLELLAECRYGSIQTAVNSVRKRHTSVYVLPGRYTESHWANLKRSSYCSHLASQSDDPLPVSEYIGSLTDPDSGSRPTDPIALSYADQRRCPHNLNLIAIMGDSTPRNDSIHCDSRLCGTQVVGTGASQGDVVIDNRFTKLNAIRADRAGGVLFRNFTVQQAEFNALYVMETDGFVVDRVTARGNDEYGILAFASDHGLIQRSDAYYNGDSGIYPGSGSDLNADNESFEPVRYAIEIRDNRSHHNTLGYSGTAGNSIHAHDNDFYDNATGISTDSLFPGHPGLPQDHARWDHNRIYRNNENWYTKYVDTGVCDKPMADRGYINGTVCPVVPVPVGTGLLIAGGNYDSTDHNWIYDNWRFGTMQFWVPSPLRDEYDPTKLYDTSNHNHSVGNQMGLTPSGAKQHNGLDFWWDDEGVGNCWEDNTSSRGTPTDNFLVDPASCADGGSVQSPGAAVKDAGFLSCSQYDRSDPTFRHPPACSWFDSPSRPTDDAGTPAGPLTLSADHPDARRPGGDVLGGANLLTFGVGVLA